MILQGDRTNHDGSKDMFDGSQCSMVSCSKQGLDFGGRSGGHALM